MKNFLMLSAACGLAITPVLSAAAFASTDIIPDAEATSAATLADMQGQCDALAAAQVGSQPPLLSTWSAVVEEGAVTLFSGPTETGPRTIDPGSIVGTGAFTWGGVHYVGGPYRIGGSVNMFGNQRATEKNFPSSTYDYTADFTTVYAHAFTCHLTEVVHHPAVHIDGHPVEGYYINNGTNPSGGGGSCEGLSPANPHWGQNLGNCEFVKTGDAVDPVDEPAWDQDIDWGSSGGGSVNQSQVDNLFGHEANGGPVTLAGDLFIGNPVVCISPKKLPGEWRPQNGYSGEKCTTAWFNQAPWWAGSQDSNGTYISVPAY